GPYLELDNANAYRVWNVYGWASTAPFRENIFVLCDVYNRVINKESGKRIGMPILYYKANVSGTKHDPNDYGNTFAQDIYNYMDNDELVELGMPWDASVSHPICSDGGPTTITGVVADPQVFYEITQNESIAIEDGRPYNSETYILISAGFDGEYGTEDDIFNFNRP
ncbi:MAG: hypothetical protein ACYS21_20120, partial [Planctomycetota bacterium]